jgi:hypothetical protein
VRFDAAGIPADEAVAATPRIDLVTTGAVDLVIFLFLGLLGVLVVYLLQSRFSNEVNDRTRLAAAQHKADATSRQLAKARGDSDTDPDLRAKQIANLTHQHQRAKAAVARLRGQVALPTCDRVRYAANETGILSLVAVEIAIVVLKSHHSTWIVVAVAVVVIAAAAVAVVLGLDFGDARRSILLRKSNKWDAERRLWLGQSAALVTPLVLLVILIHWSGLILVAVALALGGINIAIGRLHPGHFFWLGCSIFVSVALFGAAYGFVIAETDPQLSPAAVMLKDGRVVTGLWVTETSDRVYLATAAPQDHSRKAAENGGSLTWFSRSDVVIYAIGERQPLGRADAHGTLLQTQLLADCDLIPASSQSDTQLSGCGIGATGATGDTALAVGPTGPTGAKGAQGKPGVAGVRGPIGNSGSRGPQGKQGTRGAFGTQGERGPVGPRGPEGRAGPLGSAGPRGRTGPQGPQGAQGPTGARGRTGPKGRSVPAGAG